MLHLLSQQSLCPYTYISPLLEREDAADENVADLHSVQHIRCALKPVHSKPGQAKLPYSVVSKEAITLLPSPAQKDLVCPNTDGIIELKPDGGVCAECGDVFNSSNCQSVAVGIYPFATYDRIQRAIEV